MSEQPPTSSSSGTPPGLVAAALLFGVAAVIGAVAMMIFVLAPIVGVNRAPGEVAIPAESPALPAPAGQPADAVAPAPALPGGGQSVTPAPSSPVTDAQVVDDWSRYADTAAVRAAYNVNDGWAPGNDMLVAPSGGQLAVAYTIKAEAPNDYVGMERALNPGQDWREYDQLTTTVRSEDKSDRELVLQFVEWSGEAWRHRLKLSEVPADGRISIPLTTDHWEWADWSERQNKEMDLNEVTQVGLFIGHSGPGDGKLVLGPLVLER